MSKSDDGITLAAKVETDLRKLAENEATAARFLDACDALSELRTLLVESLSKAIRRHCPKEIVQEGNKYLAFVVPSPMALVKSVDTFCIIYRPEDTRFHVHSYANCNSMKQYEETRSAMRLEVANEPDISHLLV